MIGPYNDKPSGEMDAAEDKTAASVKSVRLQAAPSADDGLLSAAQKMVKEGAYMDHQVDDEDKDDDESEEEDEVHECDRRSKNERGNNM